MRETQSLPLSATDRSGRKRWDRWTRRGGRRSRHTKVKGDRPRPEWGLCPGILRGARKEDAAFNNPKSAHEGALYDKEKERGAANGANDRSSPPQHCLLMATLHYVVSGSVGVKAKVMHPTPIVVDTGSGYNVIRRSALPKDWSDYITVDRALPRLGDANGRSLQVSYEVLLRVRLGNALYRVPFLVVENLSCPVLLGTRFANQHIEAIWCRKGKIEFTQDILPIIGSGKKTKPWEDGRATISERAMLQNGETVSLGDETALLTKIRLTKRLYIPAKTQG